MRKRTLLLALTAGTVLLVAVAGCGGDDDGEDEGASDETATTQTDAAGPVDGTLTIKMGDFFFRPQNATTKAGTIEIDAPNIGDVEHELELFKSDADPASLPVDGGEVDVEAFEEQGAEEVGELEAEPGESASGSFELSAGKYVMICNLPGHYSQGMYGSITAN